MQKHLLALICLTGAFTVLSVSAQVTSSGAALAAPPNNNSSSDGGIGTGLHPIDPPPPTPRGAIVHASGNVFIAAPTPSPTGSLGPTRPHLTGIAEAPTNLNDPVAKSTPSGVALAQPDKHDSALKQAPVTGGVAVTTPTPTTDPYTGGPRVPNSSTERPLPSSATISNASPAPAGTPRKHIRNLSSTAAKAVPPSGNMAVNTPPPGPPMSPRPHWNDSPLRQAHGSSIPLTHPTVRPHHQEMAPSSSASMERRNQRHRGSEVPPRPTPIGHIRKVEPPPHSSLRTRGPTASLHRRPGGSSPCEPCLSSKPSRPSRGGFLLLAGVFTRNNTWRDDRSVVRVA